MVVKREYGDSVMIRVERQTHERLCMAKIIPREPLNDCIDRIIDENKKYKDFLLSDFDLTREVMEKELKEITNGEVIPATSKSIDVWLAAHPGEVIKKDEVIHHINRKRYDNRPENLLKVTRSQHAQIHYELKQEIMKDIIERKESEKNGE